MGGSAYTMAHELGEGYITCTERTFRKMSGSEMNQLSHELDRFLRELRGSQTSNDELPVVQASNRKIMRLNSALSMVRMYRQKTRR